MGKKTDLAKNTLIIGVGKISTQFISFLLLPIYTIYLSPADYGLVDLSLTYVMLIAPVVTIQLELAAFRYLLDARGDHVVITRILSSVLRWYVGLLGAFALMSVVVNQFIDIPYFWLIWGVVIATILSSLLLHIARGLGENKQFAIASILTGIGTLIGTILFVVLLQWGIGGIFMASIVANIGCALYLFFTLKLYASLSIKNADEHLQGAMPKYSLPLVPNTIALWIINVLDRTIITIMLGVAANGIYAVSGKFALVLGGFFSILLLSWTESVSLHINSRDKDAYISDAFNAIMTFLATLGLILIAGLPYALPLLIDNQFADALWYTPILVVGVIFSSAMSLYGGIYIAEKLTKEVAVTTIWTAVLNVILTVLLIPFWGLYGSAVATLVAFLFVMIYRHFDIRNYVIIQYDARSFLPLLVGYAVILTIFYIGNVYWQAAGLVFACIVFTLLNKNNLLALSRKVLGR